MEEWETKLRKTKGSLILTIHNTSTFQLKITSQKFENIKCMKKHSLNEIAPCSTQKIGVKLLEKNKSREGTLNISWQAQPTKSNTQLNDTNVIVMVHLHVKLKNVETGHSADVNAEIFPPHGLTHQIQLEPDTNCLLYSFTLRDEPVSTKPDVADIVEKPSSLSTQHTVITVSGSSHSRKLSRADVTSEVSGSAVGTSSSTTTTTTTTTTPTNITTNTATTSQRSANMTTSQSDQPTGYHFLFSLLLSKYSLVSIEYY
jgi:hypothetical protein